MPTYVYGCSNRDHPTVEKTHGIQKEVIYLCSICGEPLHRIPQGFQFRIPPSDPGQRNAQEIYGNLKSKYDQNKARREGEEAAYRKKQELTGVR